MSIDQLSVFLGNHPGRLLHVCRLLGEAGINIRAVNIAESKDFGVLRLIVDKRDEALRVLKNASFSAECTKVVAVEVPDVPGGLAQVLAAIDKAHLNIEYMYGYSRRHSDRAMMVFRFDDAKVAAEALIAEGVVVSDS
ncbi:MAG TPA: ACT domain-containing protein [Opitutales bacterium]|nr:ACT domain-containing protein [Opitutales bacterium]